MDGVDPGLVTTAGLTLQKTCVGAVMQGRGPLVSTIITGQHLGAEVRRNLLLTTSMIGCLKAVHWDICELFRALLPHLQVAEKLILTPDLELLFDSGMLSRVQLYPGMRGTLMVVLEEDRRHNTNNYNTIQSSVRGFLNLLTIEAARTDNTSPDLEHIKKSMSWLHITTMTMLRDMATAFSRSSP